LVTGSADGSNGPHRAGELPWRRWRQHPRPDLAITARLLT